MKFNKFLVLSALTITAFAANAQDSSMGETNTQGVNAGATQSAPSFNGVFDKIKNFGGGFVQAQIAPLAQAAGGVASLGEKASQIGQGNTTKASKTKVEANASYTGNVKASNSNPTIPNSANLTMEDVKSGAAKVGQTVSKVPGATALYEGSKSVGNAIVNKSPAQNAETIGDAGKSAMDGIGNLASNIGSGAMSLFDKIKNSRVEAGVDTAQNDRSNMAP